MCSVGIEYNSVVLDEISLEGLDGVTLQGLWERLTVRLGVDAPVPLALRNRFWHIAKHLKNIDFYLLPVPRPDLVILNRFSIVDKQYRLNDLLEEDLLTSIYPLHPVDNDYGSCLHYNTRININAEAKSALLEEAANKWGNRLVLVGSLQARWNALSPGSPPFFEVLNKAQYCILESIGRTRYNGETTWKMMSVNGESEDPKVLFYHRKILVTYNLVVKKQICIKTPGTTNAIILHLTRFDFPFESKEDNIVKRIVDMIQASPRQMLPFMEVKKVVTSMDNGAINTKKFFCLSEVSRTLNTTVVPYKELYPDATPEECIIKSTEMPLYIKVVKVHKQPSDTNQNEQDDDEMAASDDIVGSCFVGQSLLQQTYNCVYEAGPTGITRSILSKILGIDILTARMLLRKLKFRDHLQIVMGEEKRQKMEYFVCPDFVKQRNIEFDKEKKKLESMESVTIKTSKKPLEFSESHEERKSLKNLKLTNIVLEQVRSKHVIHDLANFAKFCDRQQLSQSVNTGNVDRRTILRIVKDLEKRGQVRYHKINFGKSKVLNFICEPHIEADHPSIQSVVEQSKLAANTSSKWKPPPSKSSKLTCSPSKFIKTQILHRFLFYILYSHQNKVVNDVTTYSKYNEMFKDLSDSELSPVYEDAPDGFYFVPPANEYTESPPGWMLLADMLLCVPLHVYAGLAGVPLSSALEDYLKHPIKRQILLKNLPSDIQQYVLCKKSHLYEVTEKLCFVGLLKFGERIMKEKFKVFIYLNKVGSILDTTTSAASYYQVEDKTYNEEIFSLECLQDVDRYWSRLQYICLHTVMGIQNSMLGKEITIFTPERKLADYLRSYSVTEATEMDVGIVPGDRRGAGGVDSSLYSHRKRSWGIKEFVVTADSIPKADANSKSAGSVLRKKLKVSRKVQMLTGTGAIVPRGKIIRRTVMPRRRMRHRKPDLDEVDKVALKNKVTIRTYWTSKEDRVITLTAIACSILGPKNLFGTVIRDMLYRVTNICDKTASSVRRRLLFLKKKKLSFRNMEIHMSEVKQNRSVMEKYSYLYKRLWVKENSEEYPKFLREIQIHFIELVHYLHKMIYNKDVTSKFMILPQTLTELNSQFNIYSSEIPVSEHYVEPTTLQDISHSKVQSVIHIALSSNHKSTMANRKHTLRVFLQFSEELLRNAVTQVNAIGIAVRNKRFKNKHQPASQLSSTYSLSQMYMYHLCSPTPYVIFSELYNNYKSITENNTKNIICDNLDSGMSVLLTDLTSMYGVDMKLNIPQNILIPNPKLFDDSQENPLHSNSAMAKKLKNAISSENYTGVKIQIVEASIAHSQDTVLVNTCRLETELTCQLQDLFHVSADEVNEILNKWRNDAVFEYDEDPKCNVSMLFSSSAQRELATEMVSFIESKEITGVFCSDIREQFSAIDKYLLQNILVTLKDGKVVFRVGVKKLRWVSIKYFQNWFIKIKDPSSTFDNLPDFPKRKFQEENEENPKRVKFQDDLDLVHYSIIKAFGNETDEMIHDGGNVDIESVASCSSRSDSNLLNVVLAESAVDSNAGEKVSRSTFMCSRIWMKLDGTLNFSNLWRWQGAILCYLVSHPVVSLNNLSKRFTFMIPFQLQLLVEMLVDVDCVELVTIRKSFVSLWDDGDDVSYENATVLDEYSDIEVSIKENALMKFAYFRGVAFDLKKSQDSTFSLDEVCQTNVNAPKSNDALNVDDVEDSACLIKNEKSLCN